MDTNPISSYSVIFSLGPRVCVAPDISPKPRGSSYDRPFVLHSRRKKKRKNSALIALCHHRRRRRRLGAWRGRYAKPNPHRSSIAVDERVDVAVMTCPIIPPRYRPRRWMADGDRAGFP